MLTLSRVFCLALCFCALFCRPGYSQEPPTASTPESAIDKFENTSEGLFRLIGHALAVAQSHDTGGLSALIAQLEIPDHRAWFTTVYGEEKGAELSDLYAKGLGTKEKEFRELLIQLSSLQGQVKTQVVSEPARFGFKTLTPLRDLYFADWKLAGTSDTKRDPIGYFIFLEGGFRWYNLVEFSKDVHPATIAKTVSPVYPAEAAAKGVYGSVELEVIIGKNGSVDVMKVLSGDPLLTKAAIDAVRKWRYHPLLINGQPAAAQTTITVNFDRKR